MDIKLKNNKKALRLAVFAVMLAAACFAVYAANYRFRVDDYCAENGSGFEAEGFITILFRSNYVLYPEVLEKSGKDVQLEDLYLTFSEESVERVAMHEYFENVVRYTGSVEQFKANVIEKLNMEAASIKEEYVSNLAVSTDYCVIDTTTQTILKNTTREPELLVTEENSAYAYYLVLRYDQNGRLADIKVKGNNTEQFIKNVQLAANSTDTLCMSDCDKSTQVVLVSDDETAYGKVTITQKNPQNAVFIYAMTSEQLEQFSWMTEFSSQRGMIANVTRERLYDVLGIGNLYLTFLGIMAVLVAVIARYRPHLTADTAGARLAAELVFLMLFVLSFGLQMNVVELVYYVSEVARMGEDGIFCTTFAVMVVLFGAWYWGLLSVRELFTDFGSFVRKRSLIYRYWNQIKAFCSRIWDKWKAALTIEGLDKDVLKPLKRFITIQFIVCSLACCFWFFGIFVLFCCSALLYLWLKHYANKLQMQYQRLLEATNAIAQGQFDNPLTEDFGIFERYKTELSQIQDGFGKAVEDEVRSQRMKTELITNVSHDLKTPLTAIITYVDLLKEENVTPEQRRSYLDTLERKSLRLKVLIEDLFEISKASSGNVRFYPVAVDICNLMRQVYLEHEQDRKSVV